MNNLGHDAYATNLYCENIKINNPDPQSIIECETLLVQGVATINELAVSGTSSFGDLATFNGDADFNGDTTAKEIQIVQGADAKIQLGSTNTVGHYWTVKSIGSAGVDTLQFQNNIGTSRLNIVDDGTVSAENFEAVGGQVIADEGVISNGVLSVSPNANARLTIGARDANWSWDIRSSATVGEQTLEFLDNAGNYVCSVNELGNFQVVGNIVSPLTVSGGDLQVSPNANARLLIGSRDDPNYSWDIRSSVVGAFQTLQFFNNTGGSCMNIDEVGQVNIPTVETTTLIANEKIIITQNPTAYLQIGSTTPITSYAYEWNIKSLAVSAVETLQFLNNAGQAVLSLKDNLDAVFLNNILMSPYSYLVGGVNTPALQVGSFASPRTFQKVAPGVNAPYLDIGTPVVITDNYQRIITYGTIDNSGGDSQVLLVGYTNNSTNYQYNTCNAKGTYTITNAIGFTALQNYISVSQITNGVGGTDLTVIMTFLGDIPNGSTFIVEITLELNNP